jgi:hypothetical protein
VVVPGRAMVTIIHLILVVTGDYGIFQTAPKSERSIVPTHLEHIVLRLKVSKHVYATVSSD